MHRCLAAGEEMRCRPPTRLVLIIDIGERVLVAKAAGAGEMLNIHDLEAAYEKAIGHPTSDSTVYKPAAPTRLAQTDAASISPQARLRGAECF